VILRRQQVFVRAKDPDGKFFQADVFELDEMGFRAWLVGVLVDAGLVTVAAEEPGPEDEVIVRSYVAESNARRRRAQAQGQ
jgi:hypothetical protein